jgi:pilus assembly protein CpaF
VEQLANLHKTAPEEFEFISERIKQQILDNSEIVASENPVFFEYIRKLVYSNPQCANYSIGQKAKLANSIFSSIRGLGLLDDLLADETITEMMINGPDEVFVEKGGVLQKLDVHFASDKQLRDYANRIAAMVGREVNDASPILDARLEDGSRVNVVLSPIALKGTTITIRKFSQDPMTIEKLIAYGSLTPEIAQILSNLVKARYNIFVSGGTGSGKTTFLNALSNFIPKTERLITIEDSAELQITQTENLVSLEARNANASGKGRISIRDLIRSSLRMRPDRIIVGEVRGAEALDMLQAMNTGHDGSLSTGHANSSRDMLSRLETMVLEGSEGLPLEAIISQIGSALDIIVHLSRLRDHSRKTVEITEVVGVEKGEIVLNPLFTFVEDPSSTANNVKGQLVRTANPLRNDSKLKQAGFAEVF